MMDELPTAEPAAATVAPASDTSVTTTNIAAHVTFGFNTNVQKRKDEEDTDARKRVCDAKEDTVRKCQTLQELADNLAGLETIQGRTETFTGKQIASLILDPKTFKHQITSTFGIRDKFEKLQAAERKAGISTCANFDELSAYLTKHIPFIPTTATKIGLIPANVVCNLLLEIKEGKDKLGCIPSAYGLRAKAIALESDLKAKIAAENAATPKP